MGGAIGGDERGWNLKFRWFWSHRRKHSSEHFAFDCVRLSQES